MSPTYWVALQHFRFAGTRPEAWYICKVCGSRDKARSFDDRDPAADAFKVVGWSCRDFGDDPAAALANRYDSIRGTAEGLLERLAATPAGKVLDAPPTKEGKAE